MFTAQYADWLDKKDELRHGSVFGIFNISVANQKLHGRSGVSDESQTGYLDLAVQRIGVD